jgi:hypothetical protein
MITDKERVDAEMRLRSEGEARPRAVSARFVRHRARVVIALDNGLELAFPPRMAEGLEHATAAELADIEISASGDGLHWPALDADLYIPSLLRGVFGSRSWMARRLGAAGGKANTRVKAAAARENGRKGGRPRKVVSG